MANWLIWIGPILGTSLGFAGASVGVWCALRACRTPPERQAIWRWSGWFTALALGMVAGTLLLPDPWRHLTWIVYAPLLVASIHRCNQALARLRDVSAANPTADHRFSHER